ncbi:MAG: Gfo/Idh/MocA family oxidoreductase [Chloroflexi bacterium]|nr:Gfo/Idh/MocA family oxidoreductase [Chloroflexota bacterium]
MISTSSKPWARPANASPRSPKDRRRWRRAGGPSGRGCGVRTTALLTFASNHAVKFWAKLLIQTAPLPLIVAGLGGISGDWLEALADNRDWELVAACDPDAGARQRLLAAGQLPVERVYSDLEIALRNFPEAAVLMLTPAENRFSAARLCLERGHPLLTEKPMSLDPDQALALAETARRSQVPFAVNQNYRYSSFARAVRRLLEEDAVGPIAFVECSAHRMLPAYGYRARERDVMLFEIGVHYIDLLRYWFGCDVAAVQALAPGVPFNSHSSAAVFFALIEMEGGQSASMFASRESRGHTDTYEGRWRLCGPEGSIHVNDLGRGFGVYVDRDPDGVPHLVQASGGTEDGFRPQLQDFARQVREGRPCQTHCLDNLRTLAACFAIADAYRLRQRVRVADPFELLAEPAP